MVDVNEALFVNFFVRNVFCLAKFPGKKKWRLKLTFPIKHMQKGVKFYICCSTLKHVGGLNSTFFQCLEKRGSKPRDGTYQLISLKEGVCHYFFSLNFALHKFLLDLIGHGIKNYLAFFFGRTEDKMIKTNLSIFSYAASGIRPHKL